MSSRDKLYEILGEEGGGVSFVHLRQLVTDEQITRDSFVREVGQRNWMLADQLDGLFLGSPRHAAKNAGPDTEVDVAARRRPDGERPEDLLGDRPSSAVRRPVPEEFRLLPEERQAPEEPRLVPERRPLPEESGPPSSAGVSTARRPSASETEPSATVVAKESPGMRAVASAEAGSDAETSALPRRFRVRFLVSSLLFLVLAGAVVAAVWYLRQPTPADRFEQFLSMARETIAKNLSSQQQLGRFENTFHYDIFTTDSVVSPFRARVTYGTPNGVVVYAFDYRKGTWICMSVRLQSVEREKQKVRMRRGRRIVELAEGELMMRCSSY